MKVVLSAIALLALLAVSVAGDYDVDYDTHESAFEPDVDVEASEVVSLQKSLPRILKKAGSVPKAQLDEFATELSGIKKKLLSKRKVLSKDIDHFKAKIVRIQKAIKAEEAKIADIKKRAAEIRKRALSKISRRTKALHDKLRKMMAAHKASLRFVRKLKSMVGSLGDDVKSSSKKSSKKSTKKSTKPSKKSDDDEEKPIKGKVVSSIKTLLAENAESLSDLSGMDIEGELGEMEDVVSDLEVEEGKLYETTKLKSLVSKMEASLTKKLAEAKKKLAAAKKNLGKMPKHLLAGLNAAKKALAKLRAELKVAKASLAKAEKKDKAAIDKIDAELKKIKGIESHIYQTAEEADLQEIPQEFGESIALEDEDEDEED